MTTTSRYSPITQEHTPVKSMRAKQLRRRMTHPELLVWFALKAERFHGLHFRRQQTIVAYIVDFYSHRLRLIVEVDGSVHHTTSEYDAERERVLTGLGMTIVRFSNNQVLRDLPNVLSRIELAQGALPSTTPG